MQQETYKMNTKTAKQGGTLAMGKSFVNQKPAMSVHSAVEELSTLRDMIRWGVSQFYPENLHYGHGTDNAWDEAVSLALYALNLPHDIHPEALKSNLTRAERQKIAELIAERINKRIPTPYLTHQAWFAGFPFYIDERALIPRSPIAELIQNRFEPWLDLEHEPDSILDLCTGSGCIAIACALMFPNTQVDAVDLSADALAVAKINVEKHAVEDQVTLIQSDLFAELPARKYDLIVSNPPYVSAEEMATLPQEYQHEPTLALEANDIGLAIVTNILQNAAKFLTPQGILIVEVGNSEIVLIERYPEVPFTWLEFERGGEGVFLLTAEQLKQYF